MSSGASKLGQQAPGQRSIFGGNAMPGFAQMPSYTPVTREQPEPQPEPRPEPPAPTPDYGNFGNQAAAPNYQSPPPAQPQADPQAHPGVFYAGPAQNYQSPAAEAPQTPPPPPGRQHAPAPAYPPQQAYPGQPYPGQPYPGQAQPAQAYGGQGGQPSYPGHTAPAYPAPGAPAQPYPGQTYPEPGFQGSGFSPDAGQGQRDAEFPEQGAQDSNYQDSNYQESNYQDANLQDASFPETIFPANLGQPEDGPLDLDGPNQDYGQPGQDYAGQPHHPGQQNYEQFGAQGSNYQDANFQDVQSFHGQTPAQSQQPAPQAAQSSSQRALAPFEAVYDQPPQISLGQAEQPQPRPMPQDMYGGEMADADFMGDAQMGDGQMDEDPASSIAPELAAKQGILSKFSLKNRSVMMVGSALLGAIALGGALAFAYKQSGGGIGSETPIVQADARPVKEAPAEPGGKEFPHKNKLIYDRLQNGDQPETAKIVPRQEDLALPAMPGASTTPPQAAGAPADPAVVASVSDPGAADGGPRRVKTLVVRPDGSVVPSVAGAAIADGASPQQAASAAGAPAAQTPPAAAPQAQAAAAPAPAAAPAQAASPEQVAAIPAQAQPAPKPAAAPAAAPAPAAAKAPSSYVVQVGSRKDQTEALAAFADMQQKYPSLLGSYRPMVQKADLGSKGVWYRLRIGPINDKTAASKLCGQLKSQGHSDCLVMAN